ncbi:MAG: clan AA aspartic protease [Chthoniobacterales bacterium]
MGKVVVKFKAQNWGDLEALAYGGRTEPARSVSDEALVDTGATKLYFKSSLVRQLGLRQIGELATRTMSDRSERRRVFSPVDLEVQGRSGRYDVIEVVDTLPNIIGQIPLEDLDWVVDPVGRRLIPNPEHKNGELADEF